MRKNLLINRNFSLLWTGKIVSQIGDKFYGIALAWWVLQKTNSPVAMGLLMAASVLPGLLIGPLAGVYIDRWPRKPVIVIADLIRGAAVAVITCFAWWNMLEVWHVFVTAVIISCGAAFFDPAVQAVIPRIVNEEQLPRANALSQMIGGISTVLGPILGAVAVSFLGVATVFLFNGLSYSFSGVCEGLMNIPTALNRQISKNKTWGDIKDGMRFLIKQKKILIIIFIIGIAHFFLGSLMVALPFLAKELGGSGGAHVGGVRNLGFLETMMGLGLILGSIYMSARKKGIIKDYYLFLFVMLAGVCYLLVGLMKYMTVATVIPYAVIMSGVGLAIANASIYWQSLLQLNTPDTMAGRVFSISSMIGNISLPLAYGCFGLLLKLSSIASLMIFSGLCLVILSMLLMYGYQERKKVLQEVEQL